MNLLLGTQYFQRVDAGPAGPPSSTRYRVKADSSTVWSRTEGRVFSEDHGR